MKSPTLRSLGFLILAGTILCLAALAMAQSRDGQADRTILFAPVQGGPVTTGSAVLPYAPDRVLVKFTPDGMKGSRLNVSLQKGAGPADPATGIASVDVICRTMGVTRIERPYQPARDGQLAESLGVERWFLLRLPATGDPLAIAKAFAADPNVEAATVDWRAFPATVPDDPLYPDQWGHNNTGQMLSYDWATYSHENGDPVGTPGFDANAEVAWSASQGYGSTGVIIAILDSGVDIDHPDLRLVTGYDFGSNDSNPDDNSGDPGHGTACAGVAASVSNNGLGGTGMAGGCSVMPLKVANSAGTMYFSYIQNALYYAADNGADVASMSFGAPITSDPATDNALQYAYNAGVTLLAATGNANDNVIHYPAINPLVIGVGAASPCGERKRSSSNPFEVNPGVNTDPNGYTCDGERWWGSNYGSAVQDAAGAVDIIAPTIMPTTDIGGSGGYAAGDYSMWFNGTSCSTPYAAGVCALIIAANPSWTPPQVRNQLVTTAEDVTSVESGTGWDRYTGYGMVDAAAAVGGGGPTAPVAAFMGTPTSGDLPLTVDFTDQSSGDPTSWSWTFGDGGTSTAQNPDHTYTEAGTYTVTLTASNAHGSDDETKVGYITVIDPGSVSRAYALNDIPVTGTVSGDYLDTHASDDSYEVITEVASTSHPRKITSLCEHQWEFNVVAGNAVTFYVAAYRPANGDGDDFQFAYATDGVNFTTLLTVNSATEQTYSASLPAATSGIVTIRVVDTVRSWGASSNDAVYIDYLTIETAGAGPTAPVAAFTGAPTSGAAPLAVDFVDQSSGDPVSWSWSFGDGGSSTAQNPSYTYTAPGTYTVSLTATNAHGSDTETKVAFITVTDGSGGTMHVQDIAVTRKTAGPNHSGIAVITIFDDSNQPVANTTVTATATGPVEGTFSGSTLADGTVRFETGKVKNPTGEWCFEVTGATHATLTYEPGANLVTQSCESGDVYKAGEDLAGQFFTSTPPSAFALDQNHPNPFNPITEISFSLPRATSIRLGIYNLQGARVAELLAGELPAGQHAVTWDARDAASGVYFYRLDAPGFSATRRMVLLK